MTITSLVPHFRCVCNPSEIEAATAEGYTEIYITSAKGIFKRHNMRGGRFVQIPVTSIPGMAPEPEMKPMLNFLPAGKVPIELYDQIEAFFRRVIQIRGAALEAMIFILHSAEKGYHLWVPDQSVAAASVSFDPTSLPAGSDIIMNIHSHGHMSSFFSGTDNNNDKDLIQFSGVLGNFNTPKVTSVWRFNYYETKIEYKLEDLFTVAEKPVVEVPAEWLDKVKVQVYTPTHYAGVGGYSGRGNVGGAHGVGAGNNLNNSVGKNLDHLKQFQFKKSEEYPNPPNGTRALPLVQSTNPDDYLLEGQNFQDFYTGGENPNKLPGHNPPEIPGRVWRYDPNAGIDISEATAKNKADVRESSLAVVVEDPSFSHSHEEADQTQLGKLLTTMHESNDLLQNGKLEQESQLYSLILLIQALKDVPMSVSDLKVYSQLSLHLKECRKQEDPTSFFSQQVQELELDQDPTFMNMTSTGAPDNFLELGTYEDIASMHGEDVADAWWDIDQAMSKLNGKDGLVTDLMGDMFHMISTPNQLAAFRKLHDGLSREDKDTLMSFGI